MHSDSLDYPVELALPNGALLSVQTRCMHNGRQIKAYAYDELSNRATLENILADMKASFGGFSDLGVIEADGTQLAYAGDYELVLRFEDRSTGSLYERREPFRIAAGGVTPSS